MDEFTRECLGRGGAKTLFIEPGSPWENGYVESFFRFAPGRPDGTGSVRHAARGQGAHRAPAAAVQHDPAGQRLGMPTPGSRGAAALCGRLGNHTGLVCCRAKPQLKNQRHSLGAGQCARWTGRQLADGKKKVAFIIHEWVLLHPQHHPIDIPPACLPRRLCLCRPHS